MNANSMRVYWRSFAVPRLIGEKFCRLNNTLPVSAPIREIRGRALYFGSLTSGFRGRKPWGWIAGHEWRPVAPAPPASENAADHGVKHARDRAGHGGERIGE